MVNTNCNPQVWTPTFQEDGSITVECGIHDAPVIDANCQSAETPCKPKNWVPLFEEWGAISVLCEPHASYVVAGECLGTPAMAVTG